MNAPRLERRRAGPEQAAGLAIVVALHAAALILLGVRRLLLAA